MSNEAASLSHVRARPRARAGWADEQVREQLTFTAGRILVADRIARRAKPKRADYVLFFKRDYPLAVVEAKANYYQPTDGMQQAKDYAQTLGLLFAYATNGKRIIEFDLTTGQEQEVDTFPGPLDSLRTASAPPRASIRPTRISCSCPAIRATRCLAPTSRSPSTAPSRRSSRASVA